MKKILLLLNLIAFTAISQVTPVGGYLPLNSSKSFTAGNATCSNVIARGTFSVGSTATITGQLKASSTMSLGSGLLTGGNTGTVAVLDDAIWTIHCMHNNSNPGDGTTVYFGTPVLGLPSTTATHYTISIPKNSTLIGYEMVGYINTTVPTAETATMSVRVNNTTDITLNNAITYTVGSGFQQYSSQALNTNVNAGDYFNIKVQYPTYVTNPAGLTHGVILKFKLR